MNPFRQRLAESRQGGFTLIELLAVVGILSILAAIALPNFQDARDRAKVARVKADLRAVATGLEAYRADATHYPPTPYCMVLASPDVLRVLPQSLSTPVAYLTSVDVFDDLPPVRLAGWQSRGVDTGRPFPYGPDPDFPTEAGGCATAGRRYYYCSNRDPRRSAASRAELDAAIPAEGEWVIASLGFVGLRAFDRQGAMVVYDPTNGTVSDGNVTRFQK